jgi:hypothetical protein
VIITTLKSSSKLGKKDLKIILFFSKNISEN